jgi:sucrose-6-phosphate hydrolase SacC (GH32 family)
VAELAVLRGRMISFPTQTLPTWPTIVATSAEASLEIDTTLQLGEGQQIALYARASNSSDPALSLTYDGTLLTLCETSVPFALESGAPLRVRLFIDRSVAELYVNDGSLVITTVQPMPTTPIDIELHGGGGAVELLNFTAWELAEF